MPEGDTLSPAVIDALRASDADEFCRFLRTAYYSELRDGHVPEEGDEPAAAFRSRACALKLLEPKGRHLRLTALGYEIGNVAKEYANWIDAGRRLPDGVTPDLVCGRRVLDVGCSFGRHLLGFTRHGARGVGIDFQHNYLRLSRTFAAQQKQPPLAVARARAEHLPFRSASVDVVFCRLVLNHVHSIDETIGELARVLVPGGALVLIVDPLAVPLRRLATSRWRGNGRTIGFTMFGLLNTLVLQLTGHQLRIRRRGRMHDGHSPAWPTRRWLERRLSAHGLEANGSNDGSHRGANGGSFTVFKAQERRTS